MDLGTDSDLMDVDVEKSDLDALLGITFPNTSWRAADLDLMKGAFGDRMRGMEMPPDLEDMDPMQIPPERYKEIPQTHPTWLAVRKKPRVTGSTVAKYAGLHDESAAKYLGLPKTMHVKTRFNEDWDLFALRETHGYLPNKSFDQPGAVFAKWGKWHEDNCLAGFLAQNPGMVHQECGLTIITDAMLRGRGVYDVFNDKKPIGPFPVQLGDSPDGLAFGVDNETGQQVRRGCEFKTGTPFIPKGNATYPLAEYFMRPVDSVKPYPKIKPYYVQQCFFHMLALETDECYFVSWTYGGGMKTWLIHFSLEYVSLLLSIIKYLYTRFVVRGERVPTDLYTTTVDTSFRDAYKRLLVMTDLIVKTTEPCAELPGEHTRDITNKLTLCRKSAYQKFPHIPDEYPLFMKYFFYARVLCSGHPVLTWVEKYERIETRLENLMELRNTQGFEFLTPVLVDITQGNGYTGEQLRIDVVRDELVTRCEAHVFDVLRYIYQHTHDSTTSRQKPPCAILDGVRVQSTQVREDLAGCLRGVVETDNGVVHEALLRRTHPDTGGAWWDDMRVIASVMTDMIGSSGSRGHKELAKYRDLACFVKVVDTAFESFQRSPLFAYILGVIFHMNMLLRLFQVSHK